MHSPKLTVQYKLAETIGTSLMKKLQISAVFPTITRKHRRVKEISN